MPDDCGCAKRGSEKDSLSRREFIKTTGVVVAGAALAAAPLRISRPPRSLLDYLDESTIKLALIIATADPMYQEADAEVQVLGLKLDNSYEAVKFVDSQGTRVGVVIPHLVSPSLRMGVDVALTVDLNAGLLASVHFLIGWSLIGLLNVTSVSTDYRDIPYQLPDDPYSSAVIPTPFVRPRIEDHWDFPHAYSPTPKDIDRVAAGWPLHAEDPAAGYWHYGGCTQADWFVDRGEAVFRCLEVKETLLGSPDVLLTMSIT